jgi:hypothetical protein
VSRRRLPRSVGCKLADISEYVVVPVASRMFAWLADDLLSFVEVFVA